MTAAARYEGGRRKCSRSARLLTALVLIAALGAACGGSRVSEDVSAESGQVVLYTSMPAPIVERLVLIFEEAFPDVEGTLWRGLPRAAGGGIDVQVVRAGTGALLERIVAEEETGGTQADVIWLADPAAMEELKERELLAPYAPPQGTPIPAEFMDADGYYVAGRVINMVIAWNTDLLPEGLTDWPDLITAGFGRRAFPDPGSGAALAAVKGITDTFGGDFFVRFATGGGRQVAGNTTARDAVAAGDYEAAGVLDFLVRQARDAGAPIELAVPASGAVMIPSPLAITRESANPGAAKAFADFVLSRSGQEILVALGSFYPVRSDVAPPNGAPLLAEIVSIPIDWHELRAERDQLTAMWKEAFRLGFQPRS